MEANVPINLGDEVALRRFLQRKDMVGGSVTNIYGVDPFSTSGYPEITSEELIALIEARVKEFDDKMWATIDEVNYNLSILIPDANTIIKTVEDELAVTTSTMVSSIKDLAVVAIDEDGSWATAQSVSTLSSNIANNYATATVIANTYATQSAVGAIYGVTVEANGHVSGYKSIATGTNSVFQIYAEQFAISSSNTKEGYSPFQVDTVNHKINMTSDVAINGGLLVSGTIVAAHVAANSITVDKLTSSTSGASLNGGVFALGDGANIAGFGGIGVFESNTAAKFGLIGVGNAGQCGVAAGSCTSNFASGSWNSPSSSYTSHNTYALLASSTIGGVFTNINSGKTISLATSSYAYITGGGASGSFTGGHDALVENTSIPIQGDIVVITGIASKKYFYDTSPTVKLCSTYKAKNVYGVYAQRVSDDHEYPSIVNSDGTIDLEYSTLLSTHYGAVINALGEGQINVCSGGGNIEIGDYICSSSMLGKGMKQDDDILHNYTVAKAMESVDWSIEQGTTKMIACTYHCG